MPSESDESAAIVVTFQGGPCDGLEQRAAKPPPVPEYPFPWRNGRDAIYRIARQGPLEYVYEFVEYRGREEPV